jgi:F420-dependent oxidoreductase-like protein
VKLSILFPEVSSVERAIQRIVRLEELGFHSAVMGHAFGFDPITVFALAGQRTERILLTTAVVPTYGRHPIATAMAAASAQAASKGRFRLGLGPSHQSIVEHIYGLSYDKAVRHIREYLSIVRDLLQRGEAHFEGEVFRVHAKHSVDGGSGVPVMMSALARQMCLTAGRVSDGVLPWLAPRAYVEDHIAPAVREGAAKAGRPAPPIIAETACMISQDSAQVLATVRREMGFYLAMPAYRSLFERAGVPDASTALTSGWTAGMVDAVIPWGSVDRVADAVEGYFRAGADEVVLSPLGYGPEPEMSYERTLEALGELARSR